MFNTTNYKIKLLKKAYKRIKAGKDRYVCHAIAKAFLYSWALWFRNPNLVMELQSTVNQKILGHGTYELYYVATAISDQQQFDKFYSLSFLERYGILLNLRLDMIEEMIAELENNHV